MTSPDLLSLIDQLGEASMEARSLLADIRTATKDLRQAVKESAEERERLSVAVKQAIAEDINEEVRVQIEALGEQTRKQMDAAAAKVGREFDKLANILMTGDDRGRPADGFDLRRLAEAERLRRAAGGAP